MLRHFVSCDGCQEDLWPETTESIYNLIDRNDWLMIDERHYCDRCKTDHKKRRKRKGHLTVL